MEDLDEVAWCLLLGKVEDFLGLAHQLLEELWPASLGRVGKALQSSKATPFLGLVTVVTDDVPTCSLHKF